MSLSSNERGQVVMVDDVESIPRTMAHLLKEKHDVTWFTNGNEARDTLASNDWDLALLDIDLGKGVPSGIDCLRWIPPAKERGAVCMLTGHLSPELLHAALLAGADDYLIKKIEPQKLLDEIDRLVTLGRLPLDERPRYESIADLGLIRSMQMNPDQVDMLVQMLEVDFPTGKHLAEVFCLGIKALERRIDRIESKFGAQNRGQLIRYLTVLTGFIQQSHLGKKKYLDRDALLAKAKSFNMPKSWQRQEKGGD